MSEETRDIIKRSTGELSALDFVSDSGMGLENVDKEDLALPFLKLLQSGSDETKKKHAKYVEGAEAGMFYNTVTKKLYNGEKGIEVIPVFYKMTYPEWAPFEKREGRPIHNDRGPGIMAKVTQNDRNKDMLDNGNEIIKTANADNPLTENCIPLMTCDVWEHAYYIDYRNARPKYIEAFWNLVNWNFVSENWVAAK